MARVTSTPERQDPSTRLRHTRAQLVQLLVPATGHVGSDSVQGQESGFPRSVTMKLLTNGHLAAALLVLVLPLLASHSMVEVTSSGLRQFLGKWLVKKLVSAF